MNTMTDEQALKTLAQCVDKIGRDHGTVGNYDHTLWGAGTEACTHLAARIAELEAELVTQREQNRMGAAREMDFLDRATRAEAELARCREDAARLDWLQAQEGRSLGVVFGKNLPEQTLYGTLRQAIDAAIDSARGVG